MINIRYGIFETNSSSTHTLIMCGDEEYKKLLHNELYVGVNELVTMDEWFENYLQCPSLEDKLRGMTHEEIVKFCEEEGYDPPYTLDEYFERYEYLENYEETYTTKKGEVIHAFGVFGRDG